MMFLHGKWLPRLASANPARNPMEPWFFCMKLLVRNRLWVYRGHNGNSGNNHLAGNSADALRFKSLLRGCHVHLWLTDNDGGLPVLNGSWLQIPITGYCQLAYTFRFRSWQLQIWAVSLDVSSVRWSCDR